MRGFPPCAPHHSSYALHLAAAVRIVQTQYSAVKRTQWAHLADPRVDALVTYHADHITAAAMAVQLPGRTYRFVHVVREPTAQIVSALLYELQRLEQGTLDHDTYLKLVRRHRHNHTAALFALAELMVPEIDSMVRQHEAAERDECGLNLRLEYFTADFAGTVRRLFHFLGVDEGALDAYVQAALYEDLGRKDVGWLNRSSHVTAGKYDKGPLLRMLSQDPRFAARLREWRKRLGYEEGASMSTP